MTGEIEISKVMKSYVKEDVYNTVQWLVDNMELTDLRTMGDPVRAKEVFTSEDFRTVKALYFGVIRGCVYCGATKERDRFEKCDVALNVAEFAFAYLHPEWSSYQSFYIPIRNVIEYMKAYNDRLEQESERKWNEES